MAGNDSFPDAPPEVPEIGRRFHRRHLVGIGLLAIIPVIAALGLLGTRTQVERASSPVLDVVVEYPSRVRATHRAELRIIVSPRHAATARGVRVGIEPGYLAQFAVHDVTPDRETPAWVELDPIAPGSVASVVLDLEARRFGLHRGAIRVGAADDDSLVVRIRTFILP